RSLFANKLLCPVISLFNITDADMCELSVHYIRTVPFTIHPSVNNFLWCALSFIDIFTSCTIRHPLLLHYVKCTTILWYIVGKFNHWLPYLWICHVLLY